MRSEPEPVEIDWEPISRQKSNKWSGDDDPLWLLTPDELSLLPVGTVLTSILKEHAIVGVDDIDSDTRFGYIAWGILDSQLAPAKDWSS